MKKGKSSGSWQEKLEKDVQPKIVEIPQKWARRIGHGRMLVPSPLLVDKIIRKVRKGKLATVNLIREKLALDYKADTTCPLTTGIFLNISANAAEEKKAEGKESVTPYWRILKEDGSLNPKFPGGETIQARYLKKEGFTVEKKPRSSKLFVKDFTKNLIKF